MKLRYVLNRNDFNVGDFEAGVLIGARLGIGLYEPIEVRLEGDEAVVIAKLIDETSSFIDRCREQGIVIPKAEIEPD